MTAEINTNPALYAIFATPRHLPPFSRPTEVPPFQPRCQDLHRGSFFYWGWAVRELAMFAGAGGGILGSMLLGHKIVGVNEIEEYPCRTLRQRQIDGALPGFPIWNMDIREFNERVAPNYAGMVDIVSGGFPCQDISCAGKGAGIEGERSGLWKELAETIRITRPSFAFLENSPMLTVRGLGTVLRDLAEMGFDAEWCCLGASDVGAPHQRKRIWILAYTAIQRRHAWRPEPAGQQGAAGPRWRSASMADTHSNEQHGRGGDVQVGWSWSQGDPAETSESERIKRGFKSELGRVADGVADRLDRLKGIGNAQCPQCMAEAFRILMGSLS